MNENCIEYAQTGTTTYIVVRTEVTAERKMTLGLAKPSHGQGVEYIVESAKKNAELQECR